MNLPKWAKLTDRPGKIPLIDVDADGAYESFLSELEVDQPDQYWLEVSYQCIKMELQLAMGSFAMEIRIHDHHEVQGEEGETIITKRWRQKDYPKGRGTHPATFGREAREHFKRLRGRLP